MRLSIPPILPRLVDRSVKAGLALALVAALALAVSAVIGGAEGLVVATIAGPALTIGVVNLIFDPLNRDAMAADIQEMLGRERRVLDSGLRDVLDGRDAAPAIVVATSVAVTVLPWHPTYWADHDFRPLCDLARSRRLELRVLVPTVETTTIAAFADRLSVSASTLEHELAGLPDALCSAWDEAVPHPESRLEVSTYPGVPGLGFLIGEACTAIDVGPAVRRGVLDSASQVSLYAPESATAASIRAQLAAIEKTATLAGVRPVATPQPRGGAPHALAEPSEGDN